MSSPVPAGVDLSADQRPKIVGVLVSTWVLSVLAVLLRFVARWLAGAGLWWDDWMVLLSLIFGAIPSLLPCALNVEHGLGLHVWVAPAGSVPIFLKSLVVAELFYVATTVAIKGSILLSYRRIFHVSYVKKATVAVAAMVFAWALACVLIVCLQCIPLRGYWNKSIPAKCGVNEKDYFLGKSIPDTVTDVFMLVIPLYPIWRLHVPRMQKILLTLTFLMGGLVTIISIVRLVCLLEVNLSSEDITWNFVPYLIWTCVELNVGTIAACLPCLRPIYTHFRNKKGLSTSSANAQPSYWTESRPKASSRGNWQLYSEQDEYGDQVPMQAGIKVQQDFLVQTNSAANEHGA